MKHKIKLSFVTLLLAVFLLSPYVTNAKDYKDCITDGSANDINKHYVMAYRYSDDKSGKVTLTVANGTFRVLKVEEGIYNQENDVKTNFQAYPSVLNVKTPINEIEGKELSSKKPLSFYVNDYAGEDGRTIRVTIELLKKDGKCLSREDYEELSAKDKENSVPYTGYIYVELLNYTATSPKNVDNTNYNKGPCYVLRTGDNSSKSITDEYFKMYRQEGTNYYKKVAGYCYSPSVQYNYTEAQVKSMVNTALHSYYILNLASYQQPVSQDFERAFNESVKNAEKQYEVKGNKTIRVDETLSCDYKKIKSFTDEKIDYEYVNKTSYYAKEVTTSSVTYKYNYEGGFTQTEEVKNVCTRTCEEALDVEYGPPQATVAGFCIEYQVKVTSRVKCKSEVNVQPPTPKEICQPVPYCIHSNGFENTQGGPNDEYDACIKACDGGKYSQRCSKSCYNKVYGKKGNTGVANTATAIIERLANTSGKGYTRSAEGVISWQGGGYAQWYWDHEYERTLRDDKGAYGFDSNGFKRKYAGTKNECNGICSHIGCSNYTYLNEETVATDYAENLQRYNTAIQQCQAAATCTSKTGVFKISAEYENGKGKQTLEFPLSTKQEALKSLTGEGQVQNGLNKNTTILDYNGCYKDTKENNWYMTEWSFPGIWINNKTGEISFKEITDAGWHNIKNKFCLPLDSKNVNVNWYNWYIAQKTLSQEQKGKTGSYKGEDYSSICTNYNILDKFDDSFAPEVYNIKAQTYDKLDDETGFGYFGWKINIQCFYALSDGSDRKTNSPDKCETPPSGYTTRTVINDDLFPSDKKDGDATITDANKSATGRVQGFNWSAAAEITADKNEFYANNPELIIGKIQANGNKIYQGKDHLDYEFYLTPSDLKKIKNNRGNYTDWLGNVTEDNYDKESKVYVYKSPLFRGSTSSNKSIAESAKKLGTLGCNNYETCINKKN